VPYKNPEDKRLQRQRWSKANRESVNASRRAYEREQRKHGFGCWKAMKARATNPNHHKWDEYGGRGIDMDPRWRNYQTFLADMGPRPSPKHSLDRIDNDRGYWPGNVRWATMAVQALNRRSGKKIEVTRGDYGDPWSEAA
jgi:hypothetical protein